VAMDAASRQFHGHHGNPMTPFVIDLCGGGGSDDVIKQETMSISPREPPGTSPRDVGVSPRRDDGAGSLVSYRLDQDDSSTGSGVQASGFDPDLCLSDAVQLIHRTGSPPESDSLAALAMRPGSCSAMPRPSAGKCKVCGDEATGMYFGALVCVPCKVIRRRTTSDILLTETTDIRPLSHWKF